jgi:hypothetical protein
VRWSRDLGSKISGSASVIGDLVFVSSIGLKSSWALGVNTGTTIWKTRRGAFHPAISDGRRIYFNGYSSLFGLDPKGVRFSTRRAHATRVAARERAVGRRVARHRRYLERVCRSASRERDAGYRQRRLKKHKCYAYWASVSEARRKR